MNQLNRLAIFLMLLVVVLASCNTPADPDADLALTGEPVGNTEAKPTAIETTWVKDQETEAPAPQRGGTLVRAMTSEPGQIDPQGVASSGLSLVAPYLFDTLVVRDLDNSVHPSLAESWQTAADGLSVTFHLKQNVTFHDGTLLDAEAVRFTFERFKETGTRSPIYGGIRQIAAVEVLDPLTVKFTFERPAANFFSTISMPYAGIISPESAREVKASGTGNLVGSGPFMLASWQAGQSITLTRNPAYAWGPPIVDNQAAPYVDALEYKVIPDATTQLNALRAGQVDVIFINQPSHWLELQNDAAVQLHEALENGLVYLGFNCQKFPFDNTLVRQALAHAVDKQQLVELAAGGMGEVAYALLPPTLPGFDPSLAAFELTYDPQKSRALLAEAGFEQTDDGGWTRAGEMLQLSLLTSTRAPNKEVATLLQSQLKSIGIQVEIQQLDSRAVMQATSEGQFDLLLWRYGWNDADAINVFLASDRIGSTNRVGYSNPEVDLLLEKGSHELNESDRLQLYVDSQQVILQDAPWQPLYYPLSILAISNRLKDAEVGYMGRLLLNDAYLVTEE